MKIIKNVLLASIAALVFLSACSKKNASGPEISSNNTNTLSFEEFKTMVYKDSEGMYIINGDEAFSSETVLKEYYNRIFKETRLIVHQENGVDVIWDAAKRKAITYCISKSSFGTDYEKVKQAMIDSTGAWENVSGVDFIHKIEEDTNCTKSNNNVVFDVRKKSWLDSGDYLARAFFPNETRSYRNVIIAADALNLQSTEELSLAGVLRHELGHVIGLRHEHTRPESGKCFEDNNWRPLTDYDVFSVMHYPQCSPDGTPTNWKLELTQKDIEGVKKLYPKAVVELDTVSPVLESISVPLNISTGKTSGIVAVSAVASDNKGVVNVEFYVNSQFKKADNTAPYEFSWDTTASSNGQYVVKAIAYDLAGNKGEKEITVTVENNVVELDVMTPVLESISVPLTNGKATGLINVSAVATDNKGVVNVEFYVNNQLKKSDASAPYEFNWDTSAFSNGQYVVKAIAYDLAGNKGEKEITVIVENTVVELDTVSPVLESISVPLNISTGKISGIVAVSAVASDNKGVVNVEFYVNNQFKKADNTAPYEFSWDTTASSNGQYVVKAIAYDLAGNKSEKEVIVIVENVTTVVDNVIPTVDLTSPVEVYSPAMVSGTILVKGTASDNIAVAKIELKFYKYNYLYGTPTLASTVIANGTNAWSYSLDTKTLEKYKYYKIEAVAYDSSGNISTKDSVRIYINNL